MITLLVGADGNNAGDRPDGGSARSGGSVVCDSQEWFCGLSAYCNSLL